MTAPNPLTHEDRILAEQEASERRALLENRDTPASHLRNALTLIECSRFVETEAYSMTSAEIVAVRNRISAALQLLEAKPVRLSPNTSFRDVVRGMRDAMKCGRCEKSTAVFNTSVGRQRGYRAERITKETHCSCPATNDQPAGPAFGL